MSKCCCKQNRDLDAPKRMNELELKRLRREVETTHVAFELMTEACRQWQDRANELEEKLDAAREQLQKAKKDG